MPPGLVVQRDVVTGQGGGRDLHADIAYPQNAVGTMPAVIWIHGGGWRGGTYHDGPLFALAKAGYFAASLEYRLSGEAKWPAQIEDCKLGVRWLRANAAKYNVDSNRIGAWGASAGGHLVCCLGTMADQTQYDVGAYPGVSSAVQCVVDFFGPTDLTDPHRDRYPPNSIHLVEQLLGVSLQTDAEVTANAAVLKSASPASWAKAGDPPFLIVHGDADEVVPVIQATLLDNALTQAGVPHQVILVKNARHGFGAAPGTAIDPTRAQIDQAVFTFLSQYLGMPSPVR